jgi:hypothetical protein
MILLILIKMNTSMTTRVISILLLVIFAFYAVTAVSMGAFLFASATGLIAYGLKGRIEIATAVVIIVGVLLHLVTKYIEKRNLITVAQAAKKEGFTGQMEQSDNKIIGRIEKMSNGAKMIEGFASIENGAYPRSGHGLIEGFASESTAKAGSANEVENGAPSADKEEDEEDVAGESTPAKPVEPAKKDGFGDKASTAGLFKLGELPSEKKDGPHIDAGTTIMKALGSLKQDDIKRMTSDTQSLLETQKSLLGMLSTMKPMLSEGQQLLQTFGTMFGNK